MTTVKHLVMALCRALRPFRRYEGLLREHAALPHAFISLAHFCTLLTELLWDIVTTVVFYRCVPGVLTSVMDAPWLQHGPGTDVESLKIKHKL